VDTVEAGRWLIRLTIWIAVIGWLARVFAELSPRFQKRWWRWIRGGWLLASVACFSHGLAAMAFGHCWSLANALRFTGMETRRVFGVELPESLYVNFVFVAFWLVDGVRTMRIDTPESMGKLRQFVWFVMMFNATVVFGPVYWRPAAMMTVLGILALTLKGRYWPGGQ
jgi:vacuolar-type H+-ATPase subunit I/STV1